jgi:hypothetical protein
MDVMRGGPQQLAVMIKEKGTVGDTATMDLVREHLPYWITKASSEGVVADLYKYAVLRGNMGGKIKNKFRQLDVLVSGHAPFVQQLTPDLYDY